MRASLSSSSPCLHHYHHHHNYFNQHQHHHIHHHYHHRHHHCHHHHQHRHHHHHDYYHQYHHHHCYHLSHYHPQIQHSIIITVIYITVIKISNSSPSKKSDIRRCPIVVDLHIVVNTVRVLFNGKCVEGQLDGHAWINYDVVDTEGTMGVGIAVQRGAEHTRVICEGPSTPYGGIVKEISRMMQSLNKLRQLVYLNLCFKNKEISYLDLGWFHLKAKKACCLKQGTITSFSR